MKKNIYLMRHGQTLFNFKNRLQGFCDSPLTIDGIKQAQVAGKWFKDNKIIFNKGYTSELNRTKQTISNVVPGLSYESYAGINEWNFGTAEGDEFIKHSYKYPFGDYFVAYGGEIQQQVQKRVSETMNIIAEEDLQEHVLVVAHGLVLKEFGNLHTPSKNVKEINFVSNCMILHFEYETETKTWELIKIIENKI